MITWIVLKNSIKRVGQHVTNGEYDHARKVWKTFNIKTMGEYHDLYLKSDVLLLADVFESFRKTCLQYYKLGPCHYLTSPGLCWDTMLKMTNIKLELMTNVDIFQFIEKGMRGGVSCIANRYGKADNKCMEEYDEESPSKYNMYLDANNFYGWAMSQYLPAGNFRWMTDKKFNKIDLGKYKTNAKKGLILSNNKSNNIRTKLYDKRDAFGFHIVNFPFMSSNIPSAPAYGVYASQLIRYARCCSNYSDFLLRHRTLVTKLLSQGCKVNRLSNTLKKLYGRHTDLVGQYKKNVCQMFAYSIS